MAILFADDFEGAAGTIGGRVTDGLTWNVSGSVDLDGSGGVTSGGGSCDLTIPAARFAASDWVEVEFGYDNSAFGQVKVRLCDPSSMGTTDPGNPGGLVDVDQYIGTGLNLTAADNTANLLNAGSTPTTGVLVMRLTPGSPTVSLSLDGTPVGTVDTVGSVPMDPLGDMALRFEFLFGPIITYVEVRDQSGAVIPPFWTDFVGTFEVI